MIGRKPVDCNHFGTVEIYCTEIEEKKKVLRTDTK